MLSRKYYIEIASIFKSNKPENNDYKSLFYWEKLIDDFCIYFRKDNINFDSFKFKEKCGYYE